MAPALIGLAVALCASAAEAAQKKLIEWGWDEPDAAFMREHIAEMEATPFDGCVYNVKYVRANGTTDNFSWDCWGGYTFTEAMLRGSIEDLRATPFRRFRHNFLRFNTTPAHLDWFDDHSAIIANAELGARIARAARSRGIFFDVEQYKGPLWDYSRQRHRSTKSWEEYSAQARLRGAQVMDAFQRGYPDLTIILAVGYSQPWEQSRRGWRPISRTPYGLLAPFLDGMVDAARGNARLVDGFEMSYPEKDPRRFPVFYRRIKQEVLPIVADPAKYARVFSVSFGIWLDHDWRKHGWSSRRPERNYRTPQTLGPLVRKALETADEFVWIYSETPRWWSEERAPRKLPKAYDTALRNARRGLTPD